jgi:hypothetical protein
MNEKLITKCSKSSKNHSKIKAKVPQKLYLFINFTQNLQPNLYRLECQLHIF